MTMWDFIVEHQWLALGVGLFIVWIIEAIGEAVATARRK